MRKNKKGMGAVGRVEVNKKRKKKKKTKRKMKIWIFKHSITYQAT